MTTLESYIDAAGRLWANFGVAPWYLVGIFVVAWLMFGVLLFARDAKRAPEVPPCEERPHIPVRVKVFLATPDRPELMQNCWAGKTIDRICWELSEGVHG